MEGEIMVNCFKALPPDGVQGEVPCIERLPVDVPAKVFEDAVAWIRKHRPGWRLAWIVPEEAIALCPPTPSRILVVREDLHDK